MITNGSIIYKTVSGGGISEGGDPIPGVEVWSDPIDCLFFPNSTGQLMKYQDGEFVSASFEINLELEDFNYTAIRITDNRGNELGEYQVLKPNVYRYTAVTRVKITV